MKFDLAEASQPAKVGLQAAHMNLRDNIDNLSEALSALESRLSLILRPEQDTTPDPASSPDSEPWATSQAQDFVRHLSDDAFRLRLRVSELIDRVDL